ncbi:hypothetical protein ACK3SF_02870 [Candidatus Nanosalina sp. VS9-1]|uniref:hypothetical protein n=1 Tax=Candidatus Nanosalina sp. VS9-1 TaxID=3388566 RepID=UPI0039E04978
MVIFLNIDYYDKVLAGITASLSSGAAVGVFTGIPTQYAVGGGAAISIGIMYHGIFRNGPVG